MAGSNHFFAMSSHSLPMDQPMCNHLMHQSTMSRHQPSMPTYQRSMTTQQPSMPTYQRSMTTQQPSMPTQQASTSTHQSSLSTHQTSNQNVFPLPLHPADTPTSVTQAVVTQMSAPTLKKRRLPFQPKDAVPAPPKLQRRSPLGSIQPPANGWNIPAPQNRQSGVGAFARSAEVPRDDAVSGLTTSSNFCNDDVIYAVNDTSANNRRTDFRNPNAWSNENAVFSSSYMNNDENFCGVVSGGNRGENSGENNHGGGDDEDENGESDPGGGGISGGRGGGGGGGGSGGGGGGSGGGGGGGSGSGGGGGWVGDAGSGDSFISNSRRARTNYKESEIAMLENFFDDNPYPSYSDRDTMAKICGISEARIQVWFQNRRSRQKRRQPKPKTNAATVRQGRKKTLPVQPEGSDPSANQGSTPYNNWSRASPLQSSATSSASPPFGGWNQPPPVANESMTTASAAETAASFPDAQFRNEEMNGVACQTIARQKPQGACQSGDQGSNFTLVPSPFEFLPSRHSSPNPFLPSPHSPPTQSSSQPTQQISPIHFPPSDFFSSTNFKSTDAFNVFSDQNGANAAESGANDPTDRRLEGANLDGAEDAVFQMQSDAGFVLPDLRGQRLFSNEDIEGGLLNLEDLQNVPDLEWF